MTYTSLISDLQAYLQRQDATVLTQIPRFVMLAQFRIPRELKLLGFREEVSGVYDGNCQSTGLMAKPADWRKTITFYSGTGASNNVHTPLYLRTYEYIRTVYPNPTVQGTPRFYADADYNHWLIGPSPSSGLPYKIAYYSQLVFLDNTTSTNWLTVNAPDLLLYACLMEAIPFVKADERIPVWQAMYAQAKQALQVQEMDGLYDGQQIEGQPQTPPYTTGMTPGR